MSEESLEAWEREYEAWEEKYYDDWLNIGNQWEKDETMFNLPSDRGSLRNRHAIRKPLLRSLVGSFLGDRSAHSSRSHVRFVGVPSRWERLSNGCDARYRAKLIVSVPPCWCANRRMPTPSTKVAQLRKALSAMRPMTATSAKQ